MLELGCGITMCARCSGARALSCRFAGFIHIFSGNLKFFLLMGRIIFCLSKYQNYFPNKWAVVAILTLVSKGYKCNLRTIKLARFSLIHLSVQSNGTGKSNPSGRCCLFIKVVFCYILQIRIYLVYLHRTRHTSVTAVS